MTNDQRDEVIRYVVDQASQATATAYYAVQAMESVINGEAIPEGVAKKGPAAVFRHLRERHKPMKESSFYVRPDGTIGCHRDDHHAAKAERQELRMEIAERKGEEYQPGGLRDE